MKNLFKMGEILEVIDADDAFFYPDGKGKVKLKKGDMVIVVGTWENGPRVVLPGFNDDFGFYTHRFKSTGKVIE